MLLDHTGETALVLFSEDSLTVLVFTVYFPTGADATESADFCSIREGHKRLLLQSNLTRQSANLSTTTRGIYCRAPDGSMTHLNLVFLFRL